MDTTSQTKTYEYFAFISYKREDEKWAKWLQKKLESYSLPTAIRKENPDLPNKIRPVFRDESELSGGNLKAEIEKGLNSSKYLIVICSPRSAQSPWVSKEVQHFIDQAREEYIIPFIIGGIPNASNSEDECFPEGLRQLTGEKEILGININEMGREAAVIKIIARMFNLRFDSLWQRFERAKRLKFIICLLLLFLAILTIILLCWQYFEIEKKRSDITAMHGMELLKEGNAFGAIEVMTNVFEDTWLPTYKLQYALRATYNRINHEAYSPIAILSHNEGIARAIAISPNAELFASGDDNGNLYIGYVKSGKIRYTIRTGGKLIEHVAFSMDNKKVVFTVLHQTILFDLDNKRIIHINKGSGSVAFANNGNKIITMSNGDIFKYDVSTGILDSLSVYKKFGGYAREFRLAGDKLVVSIRRLKAKAPTIALLDVNSFRSIYNYIGDEDRSYNSQLINDSTIIYRYGNNLKFVSISRNMIVDSITGISSKKFCIFDNDIFFEDGNSLMIYNQKRKRRKELFRHSNYITDLCVSNDGRYILSNGADGKTVILNGQFPSKPVLSGVNPIDNISISNNYISFSTWYENTYIMDKDNDSIIIDIKNNNVGQLHNPAIIHDDELWTVYHSVGNFNNLIILNILNGNRKYLRVPFFNQLYVTSDRYAVSSYYNLNLYDKVSDSLIMEISNRPSIIANGQLSRFASFTRLRGDTIILSDLSSNICDTICPYKNGNILMFSEEGDYLAVGNSDYTVSIYCLKNNSLYRQVDANNTDDITSLWLSKKEGMLFFASEDGTVTGYDLNSENMLFKFKITNMDSSYPKKLLFKNNELYVGTLDGSVFRYQLIDDNDIISWSKDMFNNCVDNENMDVSKKLLEKYMHIMKGG